jgi:hypothetical protein
MQMLMQRHKRPPQGAALVLVGVFAPLQVNPPTEKMSRQNGRNTSRGKVAAT